MYADKLKNFGIDGVGDNDVCISNEVAIRYIKKNYENPRVFVLGTPALIENFKARGIEIDEENPNLMVLGFDTTLSYDRLNRFCQFVRDGVDYIGVNADLNCPMEGGKFIPDCGSIARLVESSTGRFPEFFGKPSPYTLKFIVDKTGLKEEEIAFVGDRLYTDIALGKSFGVTSVLVLSGETTEDGREIVVLTLWIGTGRDQANVIKSLIDSGELGDITIYRRRHGLSEGPPPRRRQQQGHGHDGRHQGEREGLGRRKLRDRVSDQDSRQTGL